MKDECSFEKKNVFIFLKAFFTKLENPEFAGDGRPSCYISICYVTFQTFYQNLKLSERIRIMLSF